MKLHPRSFLSGALVSALVLGTAVSALAISGRMTIEVDPINIQVNGQTFAPTDVNGNAVPVFAYNGTTYAPLRALAEAYGLEVGYDAETQMATVGEIEAELPATPTSNTAIKSDYFEWSEDEETAYQQFRDLWELQPYDSVAYDGKTIYSSKYKGNLTDDKLIALLNQLGETRFREFAFRHSKDVVNELNLDFNSMGFSTYSGKLFYTIMTDKTTMIDDSGRIGWLFGN